MVAAFILNHTIFQLEVKFDEKPPKGGYIIASNHLHNMDHSWVMQVPNSFGKFRPIFFLAKDSLFKNPIGNLYFTNMGSIPVARGSGEKAPVVKAVKLLKQGHIVGLYPEGTYKRGIGTVLRKFKTGVGRMALEAQVPVVPVAHTGGEDLTYKRGKGFGFRKVYMRVGKPLYFDEYYDRADDNEAINEVTEEIKTAIRKMYVPMARKWGWWDIVKEHTKK